jgi:hypothetical protein
MRQLVQITPLILKLCRPMWIFKLNLFKFRSNKRWPSWSQSDQFRYLCLSNRLLYYYWARLLQYTLIESSIFTGKRKNRTKYREKAESSCRHYLDFEYSHKHRTWPVIKIPLGNGQRSIVYNLHEPVEGKLASEC